jgi:hypothetical protein
MPARRSFEREREAVGVAMPDAKTVDREVARIEHAPFLQRLELQRDRRPSVAPQAGQHPDDDVQRVGTGVNPHEIGALPQPQR